MAIDITLTTNELLLAANLGVLRQLEALRRNLPDKHGFEGDGWSIHIEGAAGEMAVAKACNRFFSGTLNTFRSVGDVGSVEVRTRSKEHYDLLLRTDDDDEKFFVLVTGRTPHFRVHGYIQGKAGKRAEWLQNYGGRPEAYFVPKSALSPIG